MLKERKLNFAYLPYGDICKRSTESPSLLKLDDDEEYQAFEAELEAALEEENA